MHNRTNLVSVKKDDIIVGHLPGKISQMCTLFSEWITSNWNDAMVTNIISYLASYAAQVLKL